MNKRTAFSLTLFLSLVSAAWAGEAYGGMRIESAKAEKNAIRVSSSGAEFIFNLPTGGIDLVQRIPQRRQVGRIVGLDLKGANLRVEAARCRAPTPATRPFFPIPADSLLGISLASPANVEV